MHSHCLGLRSLSAYLRSLGHEVSFVDALLLGFQRVRREDGGCLVGLTAEETASLVPADVELIGVSAPFSQAAWEAHGLLDVTEILRRRELVLRLFGPRWKSTAKRFIPVRVLPYLGSIRPLGRAQRIWRDL